MMLGFPPMELMIVFFLLLGALLFLKMMSDSPSDTKMDLPEVAMTIAGLVILLLLRHYW